MKKSLKLVIFIIIFITIIYLFKKEFVLIDLFVTKHKDLIIVLLTFLSVMLSSICILFTYWQTNISIQSLTNTKQPVLVIKKLSAYGTDMFTKTRRQLHFNLDIKNIGDSPAISVFLFSKIHCYNGNDIEMEYLPDICQYVESGKSIDLSTRYETKEINLLLKDLQMQTNKNWDRIKMNPYKTPYKYPQVINEIYYKNVIGQWYKHISYTEIGDIIVNRNKKNISIEAKDLKSTEKFTIGFINPVFGVRNIVLVDEDEVIKRVKVYEEEIDKRNIKI